jgi:hypothetical protein
LQYVSWKSDRSFRVFRRREFIGGRVMSEGGSGDHTTWWRGQGVARCSDLTF